MPGPTYLDSVRAGYDTVAEDYAELLRTELARKPLDRAMLGAFVELVRADPDAPVADLGCGPGRVTGHRHALPDAALGGPVAGYSVIHTPPELLPGVFAEFARVLRPGGHLLLAFQAGDELVHLEQAYGHVVSLDAYRLDPGRIVELLERAGFDVHAHLLRAPEPPEKTRQAFLLAHSA